MKLVELSCQGFRSLRNVTSSPGELNVVIGPNGSGKSNLLQLIELVSRGAMGELGKYVQRSGGIEPLLWDGAIHSIGLDVTLQPSDADIDQEGGRFLSYGAEIGRVGRGGGHHVLEEGLDVLNDNRKLNRTAFARSDDGRVKEYRGATTVEHLFGDALTDGELALSVLRKSYDAKRAPCITACAKELAAWTVHQNLRADADSEIRKAMVARHEKHLDPDGQNLISVLHTLYSDDLTFRGEINAAMDAAFDGDFEQLTFPPAGGEGRIELRMKWKSLSKSLAAASLSDGTLRFLMLITALACPEPPSLIAIDEPETGLHPSMFPIIAEYAVEASKRTQVLFTTHSPSFLDAFKDTLPTTTVAQMEDGETKLKTLEGDALVEWVKGYSLGKLFASGELEDMA